MIHACFRSQRNSPQRHPISRGSKRNWKKDLGCQLSGDSANDLIKSVLAFLEGAAHSSIDIPSLLYRIDVPEQELAELLPRFGHRETECLTYAILKREWEKVHFRKHFR